MLAIEQAMNSCPDVERIGITGQMHGVLYVDGAGQPVSPLYTWQDGRGSQIYREGESYADYLSQKSGVPIYQRAMGW